MAQLDVQYESFTRLARERSGPGLMETRAVFKQPQRTSRWADVDGYYQLLTV